MSDVRLTSLSHGGGCGCKIAPAALTEILAKVPRPFLDPALLVGIETSDDAAVYRLNDEQAVVATTDFFMPIVDDPFDFGRIAAANALSDIYAMGARPIFALAIVGMPLDKLPVNVIQDILAGGISVCEAAGIPIAGGHSIDSVEPIYGLVALGVIHPQRVKRNSTARAGDAIVLGKALGVGILSAALKKGALPEEGYRQMLASTTQLNAVGHRLPEMAGIHAMTDVTGFGLLGHLAEICRGSRLGARVAFESLSRCRSSRQRCRSRNRVTTPAPPRATGQVTAMTYSCRTISRPGSRRSCAIRRRAADCWSPVRRRRSPRCWHCFATRDSPAPR